MSYKAVIAQSLSNDVYANLPIPIVATSSDTWRVDFTGSIKQKSPPAPPVYMLWAKSQSDSTFKWIQDGALLYHNAEVSEAILTPEFPLAINFVQTKLSVEWDGTELIFMSDDIIIHIDNDPDLGIVNIVRLFGVLDWFVGSSFVGDFFEFKATINGETVSHVVPTINSLIEKVSNIEFQVVGANTTFVYVNDSAPQQIDSNKIRKDWYLENGKIDASIGSDNIYNLVRNSILVDKGTLFFAPYFGSELYKINRENGYERARLLSIQYSNEALKWLLDSGKAKKITVNASFNEKIEGRIDIFISVYQSDGELIPFTFFKEVS